jgi:hypothetical protein
MVNFMINLDVIDDARKIDSTTRPGQRLIPPFPLMLILSLVALWPPGVAVAGDMTGSASDRQQASLLADASTDSCVAECEGVRKQCKILCGETTARAAVQTGDDPHQAEGVCLHDCEEDYTFCVESC